MPDNKKSDDKIPADIQKMSFEEALEELENIVRALESGQGALDDAINSYARGAHLKKHCESKLKNAQTRIEKIVTGPDGELESVPADLEG